MELEDASRKLHVTWKAMLHDRADYVRQEVTIRAVQEPSALARIVLVDVRVPGGSVVSGM